MRRGAVACRKGYFRDGQVRRLQQELRAGEALAADFLADGSGELGVGKRVKLGASNAERIGNLRHAVRLDSYANSGVFTTYGVTNSSFALNTP